MNKALGYILTGILSAAVASGTTYLILNKRYNDMMNEEYQEWKHKEPKEPEGEIVPEYEPDEIETKKEEQRVVKSAVEEMNRIIEEENYLAESESPRDDESDEITIISCSEYDNEHPEYNKKTYLYYDGDDVLIEESTEELILKPEDEIGYDALTSFEPDSNTVYVRNPKISTDFEIVKMEMSYYQAAPDENEKRGRKNRNIWDE